MQTRQAKTHSPSTASTAAESTPKAAVSAAAVTRVPAWANAWGDHLPKELSLDEEVMAQPDSSVMSRPGDRYEREADRVADQVMQTLSGRPPTPPVQFAVASPAVATSRVSPMIQRAPADTPTPATNSDTPAATPTPQSAGATTTGQSIDDAVGSEPLTSSFLVEDDATDLGPGQMKKTAFLAALQEEVCKTADEALVGTIWSSVGCPWVTYWFGYYGNRSAQQIEKALRRFASETANVTSANDYIPLLSARVRRSIATWATTGELTGVPEGVPTKIPETPAPSADTTAAATPGSSATTAAPPAKSEGVQLKPAEGSTAKTADPQTIRGQLGAGNALDGSTQSRMGSAFGTDFSHVRMHTESNDAALASSLGARAFTVGADVAFGAGEYRPGTLIGDALIAHELAHVVQQKGASSQTGLQQKGETEYSALEEDADSSAVSAMLSTRYGIKGTMTGLVQNAMPRLQVGLKLQRCSTSFWKDAPDNLQKMSAEEKANWIKAAMKEDKSGTSREIVKVFQSASSPGAFLDLQKFLDMDAVIDYLDDWDAVQVGALGPVTAGGEKLNQKRADSIVQTSHDFGLARGQTFTYFIFNSMYTDDMKAVLKILAQRRRLKHTIEEMDAVKELITERGLKLSDYQDEKAWVKDVFRGIGRWLGDFLGSSEAGKFGKSTRYYALEETLPEEYQKILDTIDKQELEQALSPKNLALGMADYLTFGIPSGIYGLVAGTVHGVKDIAQGDIEQGTYELMGAAIVVLSFLGVKAYRALKGKGVALAPGDVMGPAGSGQFVIKGYTGPITQAEARLGALLQLNAEAQGAAGLLLERLGKQGVIDVGRYVQANSKAAVFVYERGLPAVEALQKAGGDLAKAEALLNAEAQQVIPPKALPPASEGAQPAGGAQQGAGTTQQGTGTQLGGSSGGNRSFPNQLPEQLSGELAEAQRLGVKPIKPDDSGFGRVANSGTVKWVVTEQGELRVIPKNVAGSEISHTVLTNGQPVLAAGEAEISVAGKQVVGIDINNHSGHYMPTPESVTIGKAAFAKYGITFP